MDEPTILDRVKAIRAVVRTDGSVTEQAMDNAACIIVAVELTAKNLGVRLDRDLGKDCCEAAADAIEAMFECHKKAVALVDATFGGCN